MQYMWCTFNTCNICVIYLLEQNLCQVQCSGKEETPFKGQKESKKGDHRKGNVILANKYFTLPRQDFNNNAKFTLSELPTNAKQVTEKTVKEN